LLNKCFIPDNLVQELRTYQRLRKDPIRNSAMHIQHMQKALILMNIRLKEVISQIHGARGMRIIRAKLSGKRSAEKLASLCDSRILRTKKEWVLKSLKGYYNESRLFSLEQAVHCYDFYQQQITNCEIKLEQVLKKMLKDEFMQSKNNKDRKPIRYHKPTIDNMGAHLMKILKK
tara:strand:+ start:666 stop:1187 length:522 start_codon:yes stop_codon:yes gene_type:complete